MSQETNISYPSRPEVVSEDGNTGTYRIDGLYPGYGYTLGNSLRRIILSSLSGTAPTAVKIDGAKHEFATVPGVKEDVITILMRLKNVRFSSSSEETQTVSLSASGTGEITAGDFDLPGQVEIANPELVIANITDDEGSLDMEVTLETGLGYIAKEELKGDKLSAGQMALDASFSPIRRANYHVEDMRVGDRTDFNRLELTVETDGTIAPKKAIENAIEIMIRQLQSVIELDESVEGPQLAIREESEGESELDVSDSEAGNEESDDVDPDDEEDEFRKTRVEKFDLPTRTKNALDRASIRTVGGLLQKSREDLTAIDGLGGKGIDEIEEILEEHDVSLKDS